VEPFLRNDADLSSRHRVRTVLDYLDIQPGQRVLDCGCGLGWMLKIIGETYDCRLFGIDADPERLSRASRAVGDKAQVAVATIEALPFPAGSFDRIVLAEVLEHISDDLRGLRDVARVLKPGGLLAITVPNCDYPFWWDPVNRCREQVGLQPIRAGMFGGIWTNHKRLYSRREILDLVTRAELKIEDARGLVHHCLPFSHNLVYGVGKSLLEAGLLPKADRFRYAERSGSRWSPLAWGFGLVDCFDRMNPGPVPEGEPAVCIAVKARKPA
jgi:SAM-dependent methyltransferase